MTQYFCMKLKTKITYITLQGPTLYAFCAEFCISDTQKLNSQNNTSRYLIKHVELFLEVLVSNLLLLFVE